MADNVIVSSLKRRSEVPSANVDTDATHSPFKKTHININRVDQDRIILNCRERTMLLPLLRETVSVLLPDLCKIIIAYGRASVGELIQSHIVNPQRPLRLISLSDGLWCWDDLDAPVGHRSRFDDNLHSFVSEPADSPFNSMIGNAYLMDTATGCATFGTIGNGNVAFVTASTASTSVWNSTGYEMRDPHPNSTTVFVNGTLVILGNLNGQMCRLNQHDPDMLFDCRWFCRISAENSVRRRIGDNAVCLLKVSGTIRLLRPGCLSSCIESRDTFEYPARYQDKMVWLTRTELCILSVNEPLSQYSINRYRVAEECHGTRIRFPAIYEDGLFAFRDTTRGVRLLEISLAGALSVAEATRSLEMKIDAAKTHSPACQCAPLPTDEFERCASVHREWKHPVPGERVRLIRPANRLRGLHAIVVSAESDQWTFVLEATKSEDAVITWKSTKSEGLDWERCRSAN